ncbi:MAG TPA: hypothetical protein VJT69_20235 [Pyrinomonadaceae bacterium]|nr:hypothetical protein [Pyrinomonadaceae bacterium]
MDLAQRKKIELQQKLESLQSEFESWRDKSKAFQPLEKHYSQIHRVTLQLESLNTEIKSELDQLGTGSGVLTQARQLELAILESHRVWEFFRSKLSLRSIEWFNKYLIAADELAWECYSAAQNKLDPNYLAKEKVKEPPLVFFNGGSSPFTMPRDYAFEAEAVPGEAIKSEGMVRVLRALPIPVIGVPWFQIQHLPEMLVVAHEVGHDVESDFKLTADLKQALNKAMDAAKTDATHRPAWQAWLGEIFADVYGVLSCGPAFVQALIDFLATDPDQTTRAIRTAPKWGLYPTDYLRVLINIEALDETAFKNDRTRLRDQWTAIYAQHQMTDYEKDIPVVVKAIIDGPYRAFGGASLKDVISFSVMDQYNTNSDANRMAQGAGPAASNTRTLFAAAATIFARDPEQYGKLKLQQLILDHVNQIRTAGVRGSQTTVGSQLGTLDDDDKAAGKTLFQMLKPTVVEDQTDN